MTITAPVDSQVTMTTELRRSQDVPEDNTNQARPAISPLAREGVERLASQRLQRSARLYVRTQQDVRDLVDEVASETGAQIVEVIEYAILHTYGTPQDDSEQ